MVRTQQKQRVVRTQCANVGKRRKLAHSRTNRARRPHYYSNHQISKGIRIPARRELRFYSRPISTDGKPTVSWLDHLWTFGLIALKLFVTAVTSSVGSLRETKVYPLGATQSVLIGIDECLVNHPFVKWVELGGQRPTLPYCHAKLHDIVIRLKVGAKLSERAGRLVIALIELSRREAEDLLKARRTAKDWKTEDKYSYEDILQVPGARTFPMTSGATIRWKPTNGSFASELLEIGQQSLNGTEIKSEVTPGGLPFLKVLVGYSDFASDTGSAAELYGADEAEFTINIQSNVTLSSPGTAYLRAIPAKTIDPGIVTVSTAESFGRIKYDLSNDAMQRRPTGLFLVDGALERAKLAAMEI